MIDLFGRKIDYLRISVTNKCDFNCIYCNPLKKTDKELLSVDNISKIAKIFAKQGIGKIRITGGEPLARMDICKIVKNISEIEGIKDIAITTNGSRLLETAEELKKSGLNRINISLDSLKENTFENLTGRKALNKVISGINKCIEIGLNPVKINTVLIKGINDNEIDDFILLTKEMPIEVRFIELMPIGEFGEKNKDKVIFNEDIIKNRPNLQKFLENSENGPAEYYKIQGHRGKVGFISPLGHKFCQNCNRIRLTSDGKIRLCLGNNQEFDVIPYLNQPDWALEERLKIIINNKPFGHRFEEEFLSNRRMNGIGG